MHLLPLKEKWTVTFSQARLGSLPRPSTQRHCPCRLGVLIAHLRSLVAGQPLALLPCIISLSPPEKDAVTHSLTYLGMSTMGRLLYILVKSNNGVSVSLADEHNNVIVL